MSMSTVGELIEKLEAIQDLDQPFEMVVIVDNGKEILENLRQLPQDAPVRVNIEIDSEEFMVH